MRSQAGETVKELLFSGAATLVAESKFPFYGLFIMRLKSHPQVLSHSPELWNEEKYDKIDAEER